ncbi:MAG: class I tRNA ligase family protein, partial [Anaerolineales bacterium]|nr:class I tRNA ligase family protein [Anaerolineales bacterium]
VKQVIGRNGRLLPVEFGQSPFESLNTAKAEEAWEQLAGLTANQAKKISAQLLSAEGSFVDGKSSAMPEEPRAVEQVVKFYEKGDRPLEFVTTRQWFVKILKYKDELKAQGEKIEWHPSYMRSRYQNWVDGLNQDWCISRQRYFGVPFPVWYPVGSDGEPDYSAPIYADSGTLPVDPLATPSPGYSEEQRDKPGGFSGEPDVMDTWATSSLTPQIQSHWGVDPEKHAKLFPMDVRPQSHEIIRTWAFYTIVKAWMHEQEIPWRHVVISGWILDPDRKKMSKSKGNVVTPENLLTEWSSDAIRYWAARARLGADTAFDPSVFKVGRRLAVKVFNASRFVIMQLDRGAGSGGYPDVDSITEPLDLAMVARMRKVITQATASFESFDYAAALQTSEEAFWNFCDHYLELVKIRSYLDDDTAARRSALAGLAWGLKTFLRLLAPFLPYMTEEVWSWRYSGEGRNRSVHTSQWPAVEEVASVPAPQHEATFDAAIEVLSEIRATKTRDQKSLRWPVSRLVVTALKEDLEALYPVFEDVLLAGNVPGEVTETVAGDAGEGQKFLVVTELAEENEDGVSGGKS